MLKVAYTSDKAVDEKKLAVLPTLFEKKYTTQINLLNAEIAAAIATKAARILALENSQHRKKEKLIAQQMKMHSVHSLTVEDVNIIATCAVGSDKYQFIIMPRSPHSDFVGKGGQASVQRAYLLDPKSGLIDKKATPLIVKRLLDKNKYFKKDEVAATAKLFHSFHFTLSKSDQHNVSSECLVSEYKPRTDMRKYFREEQFKQLSFSMRAHLLWQYAQNLHCLHTNNSHGAGFIHRDLKPSNIIVNDEDGAVDLHLIDMGFSTETDGLTEHVDSNFRGTTIYMAPETLANYKKGSARSSKAKVSKVSTRTDIFTSAAIVYPLFGSENPLKDRKAAFIDNSDKNDIERRRAMFNTPFNHDGFGEGIDIPKVGLDLPKLMLKFVKRMEAIDESERPDSNDFLRFSTSVKNISVYHDYQPEEKDSRTLSDDECKAAINIELSRLILLAGGVWQQPSGYNDMLLSELHYFVNDNLCQFIVDSYKRGDSMEDILSLIPVYARLDFADIPLQQITITEEMKKAIENKENEHLLKPIALSLLNPELLHSFIQNADKESLITMSKLMQDNSQVLKNLIGRGTYALLLEDIRKPIAAYLATQETRTEVVMRTPEYVHSNMSWAERIMQLLPKTSVTATALAVENTLSISNSPAA